MFINVLTQVIILFILILLGVILTKAKLLNDAAVKGITELVLLLVTPCVIIKTFIREFDPSALKNLGISALAAFLAHLGFILLSRLLIKQKNIGSQRVLQYGVIFSNCGYMSIPLQQALLGDEGVFYSAAFIAVFNLFVWSYGVILMSGDKKYMTPKKLIINPGVIAVIIGLAVFLLSIPVPKVIYEPISYLASLNTPLPMIIIGFYLANTSLGTVLKNIGFYIALSLRLFIFPLLSVAVMYLCGIRGVMLVSLAISCSAPTAANTTMFSSKFGADTSLSVKLVAVSSILSLISMPVIILLAEKMAGI